MRLRFCDGARTRCLHLRAVHTLQRGVVSDAVALVEPPVVVQAALAVLGLVPRAFCRKQLTLKTSGKSLRKRDSSPK